MISGLSNQHNMDMSTDNISDNEIFCNYWVQHLWKLQENVELYDWQSISV